MDSHAPTTQVCGSCKTAKPLDEYSPSYRGKRGTWCRSCFAAYNRGGKMDRGQHPALMCVFCSKMYIPKQLKDKAAFCSRGCKERARKLLERVERLEAKPDRTCQWCGNAMPKSMRSDACFCSDDCNMQAHRRTRNLRRRSGAAAPLRPRLAPLINLAEFAADHDHMCHLCCEPVDMNLRHPDPMCASVDHVLPRALGGTEDIDNLQLTHLVCNLRKQHRI